MTAVASATLDDVRRYVDQKIDWHRVFTQRDAHFLISLMSAIDQRTGERFTFEHIRDPLKEGEVWLEGNKLHARDKSWRWQRYVVDRALTKRRTIDLKGRQIGDTWTYLAVDVAEALTMPATTSLLFRQRERELDDAAVVERVARVEPEPGVLPVDHLERGGQRAPPAQPRPGRRVDGHVGAGRPAGHDRPFEGLP